MYSIYGDKVKIFKVFVIISIISFLGLFFAYSNGYSENMRRNKINLTNEKIEEFENDVMSGENISINDYLDDDKDYSTKTSKASLKVSSKIENIVDYSIKFIFRKLGNMVE